MSKPQTRLLSSTYAEGVLRRQARVRELAIALDEDDLREDGDGDLSRRLVADAQPDGRVQAQVLARLTPAASLTARPIPPPYRARVCSAVSSTPSSSAWQRVRMTTKSAGPGDRPPPGSAARSTPRTSLARGKGSGVGKVGRSSTTIVSSPISAARLATRSPTWPAP